MNVCVGAKGSYMEKEVSICIPIYNTEKYIGRCLASVFSQTYFDICRVILVNDCTSDDSMEVVESVLSSGKEKATSVEIITHKKNRGLAASRQSAFEKVDTKYVVFIDSDDWLEPDYIEKLYMTAEKEKSDIVVCDLFFEYAKKRRRSHYDFPTEKSECFCELLHGKLPGYLHIKFIRTDMFDKKDTFWHEGCDMNEDLIVSVHLFWNAKMISYIPLPLYHYNRANENSLCNSLSDNRVSQILKAWGLIDEFLNEKGIAKKYENEIAIHKHTALIWILTCSPRAVREKYSQALPAAKSTQKGVAGVLNRFIVSCYRKKHFSFGNFLVSLKNKIKGV